MRGPPSGRHPSPLRRVSLLRGITFGLLALGPLLLLAFLVPLWVATPERIVTLSAETQKLTIVFTSTAQSWTVGGARLCGPGADCAVGESFGHDLIDWRACDSVEIERSEATGGVIIRPSFPLLPGGGTDTALFLDDARFRSNGVQAFTGYVRIGDDVQSGRSTQLLSGDYTFYERDTLSWLLRRWNADAIQSGSLRHGDEVSVVRRAGLLARLDRFRNPGEQAAETDCPATADEPLAARSVRQEVFGHVAPPPDREGNPGLLATVTSTSGNVALNVLRRGLDEPLTLRPDWIDVVIASPAFLALTLILTYLASVLQAFVPSGAPKPPQDEA